MRHLLLAFTALLSCSRGAFRTPKHARMGDNCYHVFLDVGSNRGVHGRFYFEPEKYPGSKFAKRFTELIPDTATRRKTSCVFAFEPNPVHVAAQEKTMSMYRAMGWRYYFLNVAAGDERGNLTFWLNNEFYGSDERNQEFAKLQVGFATENRDPENPNNQHIDVPTIDLSHWIRHQVLMRKIPDANDGEFYDSSSPPLVIMKMDIEGSEYRTYSKMVLDRVACQLDHIYGEVHAFRNRYNQFSLRNGIVLDSVRATQFFWALNTMLRMENCKTTWIEFDDEQYHTDGQPYPTAVTPIASHR